MNGSPNYDYEPGPDTVWLIVIFAILISLRILC